MGGTPSSIKLYSDLDNQSDLCKTSETLFSVFLKLILCIFIYVFSGFQKHTRAQMFQQAALKPKIWQLSRTLFFCLVVTTAC